MQFETPRLIIRDWSPREDARHAMDLYGDARVTRWLNVGGQDRSALEVQRRLQGYAAEAMRNQDGIQSWAVVQKDIARVIGTVVLSALPDIKNVRGQQEIRSFGLELVEPRPMAVDSFEVDRSRLDSSKSDSFGAGLSGADSSRSDLSESGLFEDGLSTDYVEIGWYFRPASWGYGYATEAAFWLVRYGFEVLSLPMLLAVVSPENTRAEAMAKRLGMRYGGLTTRRFGGEALMLYLLEASEWKAAEERWLTRFRT